MIPKNKRPGLTSPGDSGFKDSSDSDEDFENAPLILRLRREKKHKKRRVEHRVFANNTTNSPWEERAEEIQLKCPKTVSGENCPAHKSNEDKKFVSYMCPQIASKEQCLNPDLSTLDHWKENIGRVINFLTRIRHKEVEEEKKNASQKMKE